jgi:hypothetical protein
VPEVRARLRALYESGLLPTRSGEIGYDDLARTLLAFAAPTQHLDAAEVVRRFCAFCCTQNEIDYGDEPLAALQRQAEIERKSLLEITVMTLQPGFWLSALEVDTTQQQCVLTVRPALRRVSWVTAEMAAIDARRGRRSPDDIMGVFVFSEALELPPGAVEFVEATVFPMQRTNAIRYPLISHLLHDLMGHPLPGSDQTESAAHARAALPVNEPTPDAHAEGSDRLNSSNPIRRVRVSSTRTRRS